MKIIQIVPRIFPAVDGVGDYALYLARQLRQDFGIETHFLVGDCAWTGEKQVDGFAIDKLTARTSNSLFSLLKEKTNVLPACSVVLQYVGGGYANRGCPLWLVGGLEQYRAFYPQQKIITMFHETYGSGPPYYGNDPPWLSAFWLAPLQKNIAKRITVLSNHCFTSRDNFREQLHNLTNKSQVSISLLPVFSNVGETHNPLPPSQRESALVVFGSRLSRARTYQQFMPQLKACCRMLYLEKIYDIGPDTGLDIHQIERAKVISLGKQTTKEIAKIFSQTKAGILNYHPEYLAKSGVFAAYCAYGIIPTVAFSSLAKIESLDDLIENKHYLLLNNVKSTVDSEMEKAIAHNAYQWYLNHDLPTHARMFYQHFDFATTINI